MPVFPRIFGDGPRPADPLPFPPQSPEGLAARWVRWAAMEVPARNLKEGEVGIDAGTGQPDDVWFLGAVSGGTTERRSNVPAGTPIFLPVFNLWALNPLGPVPPLPRAYGTVTIDGEMFTAETIVTPGPFEVVGARRNPVTRSHRPVPVTVWGLWKKTQVLASGSHILQINAGDGEGFVIDVTYHLEVAAA